jgi:hypothetical protein
MSSNGKKPLIASLLISALMASVSFTRAEAREECQIIPTELVFDAFTPISIHLINSDPSGMCIWTVENAQPFSIQISTQDSYQAANQLYDDYKRSYADRQSYKVKHKTIGQESHFSMSGPGDGSTEATLLALVQDRVVSIRFYPRKFTDLNTKNTMAMLKIGKLVLSQPKITEQ